MQLSVCIYMVCLPLKANGEEEDERVTGKSMGMRTRMKMNKKAYEAQVAMSF